MKTRLESIEARSKLSSYRELVSMEAMQDIEWLIDEVKRLKELVADINLQLKLAVPYSTEVEQEES